MSAPSIKILGLFVTDSGFTAIEPSYRSTQAVSLSLNCESTCEPAQGSEQFVSTLAISAQGTAKDESLLFTANVTVEAVFNLTGSPSDSRIAQVVQVDIAGRLFAIARERLTALTQFTGYGPLVLPPVTDEYLKSKFSGDIPMQIGAGRVADQEVDGSGSGVVGEPNSHKERESV